ncbi:hypothetical protein FQR65_LT16792 [Abscondita terminalis]|nr:hypothetical protein FQR65_LT16792 [Abscondita terminalis]
MPVIIWHLGGVLFLSRRKSGTPYQQVVSITGVNFGRLSREGFAGYDPIGTLEAIAEQRTAEAKGAQLRVDGLLPSSVEEGRKAAITDMSHLIRVAAADIIEKSDLDLQFVRPSCVKRTMMKPITKPRKKGEPFTGTEVREKAVAAYITDIIENPTQRLEKASNWSK